MNKKYLFIILNIISTSISATIRNVPSAFNTINSAINASFSNDTILVSPGIYFDNISIDPTKTGLKLMSISGAANTIIDGGSHGSVIKIEGNDSMDAQTYIQGFIVRNGRAPNGAGCYLSSTNVLFRDVIIKNDTIDDIGNGGTGAGIVGYVSSITLINSSVKGNMIKFTSVGRGAGIMCESSTLNLFNCQIESNKSYADNWNYGGGIFLLESYLNMNSCRVQYNSLFKRPHQSGGNWEYGGGIFLADASADIINSLITDNVVDTTIFHHLAGGIYIASSSTVTAKKINIRHCTITNNFSGTNSDGSQIYNTFPAIAPADALLLENCILWSDNSNALESGLVFLPMILNCDIKDSLFLCQNCIHSDPLFATQNDFHVTPNSPCVNKGIQVVDSDLDHNVRPMPAGQLPDIGCYEIDESINGTISVQKNEPIVFLSESTDRLIVKNSFGYYNIFNLSGQIILSGVLKNENENSIDVSLLPKSVYLISILQNEKKGFTQQFLLMR